MAALTREQPIETRLRLGFEVDPRLTLAPLWQATGHPQMRVQGRGFVRASRTAAGPASLRVTFGTGDELGVEAWGSGAEAAIEGLPELLGAADDPSALVAHHPIVRDLARRTAGLRLTRTRGVFDMLVPAIIGQKVTGFESRNSYRGLVAKYGEPAPGPLGLRLPPAPEALARQPYWALHELGLEQRRAEIIGRAAADARSLEATVNLGPVHTRRRLLAHRGVGPWTAAETMRLALGDPDALSTGDFHLPNLVSWLLAGEPRGSDERMLELLSPYEGQRARVALLLEMSGMQAPRYGPRLAPRSIAAM